MEKDKIANKLGIDLTHEGEATLHFMEECSDAVIEVGYQVDQKADDNETILAEIAYWNHYGTIHKDGSVLIPARPFMDAIKTHEAEVNDCIRREMELGALGLRTSEQALNAIGSKAQDIVRNEITDGDWTPNAPVTIEGGWIWNEYAHDGKGCVVKIEGKHSSRPLIDNGDMRRGVNFVIRNDKEGIEK